MQENVTPLSEEKASGTAELYLRVFSNLKEFCSSSVVRISKMKRTTLLFNVILISYAAISLVQGVQNALIGNIAGNDFQWQPSRQLLFGHDPYMAYLAFTDGHSLQNQLFMNQVPNYPAVGLIFLWPIAVLPWPIAKLVWCVLNIVLSAVLIFAVNGVYFKRGMLWAIFLFAFFISGTPFRNSLALGQQDVFSLAFFAASVYSLQLKHTKLSGVLLAISWLKYSLTFPLTIFFLKKKGLPVIALALSIQIVLIILLGIWTHQNPLRLLWEPVLVAGEGGVWAGATDLFSIAKQVGFIDHGAVIAIDLALLGIATLARLRASSKDDPMVLAMLSLLALICCVHRAYDCVVLVYPACYVLWRAHAPAEGYRRAAEAATKFILCYCVIYYWYLSRLLDPVSKAFHSGALLNAASSVSILGLYVSLALLIGMLLAPYPAAGTTS